MELAWKPIATLISHKISLKYTLTLTRLSSVRSAPSGFEMHRRRRHSPCFTATAPPHRCCWPCFTRDREYPFENRSTLNEMVSKVRWVAARLSEWERVAGKCRQTRHREIKRIKKISPNRRQKKERNNRHFHISFVKTVKTLCQSSVCVCV